MIGDFRLPAFASLVRLLHNIGLLMSFEQTIKAVLNIAHEKNHSSSNECVNRTVKLSQMTE